MSLMHPNCPEGEGSEYVRRDDGHLQCTGCGRNLMPALDLPQVAFLPAAYDERLDVLADLARRAIGIPYATVSLVDQQRQALLGMAGDGVKDADRDQSLSNSLCQYVVMAESPVVIQDTETEPFLGGQFRSDYGVRSYVGFPIRDIDNRVVGSMCGVDMGPREWTEDQIQMLGDFAKLATIELQTRGAADTIRRAVERFAPPTR